jgi:hypothetical protein
MDTALAMIQEGNWYVMRAEAEGRGLHLFSLQGLLNKGTPT